MFKCQEIVDSFIDFARTLDPEKEKRLNIIDAYGLILPDSPIYQLWMAASPIPAELMSSLPGL